MPEYEHSCFISYRHPQSYGVTEVTHHFWMEFITAFQKRLEGYLTLGLSIYRDDQLRAKPGVNYPAELSSKLCRSVCLIAILVPEYLESNWCVAEWKAMEKLEQDRLNEANSEGLIIPVLFRGEKDSFAHLWGSRQYSDFRKVDWPGRQLNNIASRQEFEAIARRIKELSKIEPRTDCSKFAIESGEEMIEPRLDDPNPLV